MERAIYGNTTLYRGQCGCCGEVSFVKDGRSVCCDEPAVKRDRAKRVRESQPRFKRRRPTKADQARILTEQQNRCFYCGNDFGVVAERTGNGKPRLEPLAVRWDHWEPFSHSANNNPDNFVAACQVCNAYKSNLIFDDQDAARLVLLRKWEKNGWRLL
jgi:5-methylcytosine-specific restriction endonuclease McrA